MYREDDNFRKKVLAMSATGKILRKALGDDLFMKITWDNSSPTHGYQRDHRELPDIEHVVTVIGRHQPDLILCFGQNARDAVNIAMYRIPWDFQTLYFPHPQARGLTSEQWNKFGTQVKKFAMAKYNR